MIEYPNVNLKTAAKVIIIFYKRHIILIKNHYK